MIGEIVFQVLSNFVIEPLFYAFLALLRALRWLLTLPVRTAQWVAVNFPSGGRKPPLPRSRSPADSSGDFPKKGACDRVFSTNCCPGRVAA
jgi:hypothetical protein